MRRCCSFVARLGVGSLLIDNGNIGRDSAACVLEIDIFIQHWP